MTTYHNYSTDKVYMTIVSIGIVLLIVPALDKGF